MKARLHANGNGTYVYEVEFDTPDVPTIDELLKLEQLRNDLVESQTPVTRSIDESTANLLFVVETLALAPTRAFSTMDIVESLANDITYLDARQALLTLSAHGCVKRHGNGGRGGYRYQFAPGWREGGVEPPELDGN